MSTAKRLGMVAVAWVASALPAAAAAGARTDHSGILVWSFLGLCALIILAQAAPAAILFVELVKGAWAAKKLARQEARR